MERENHCDVISFYLSSIRFLFYVSLPPSMPYFLFLFLLFSIFDYAFSLLFLVFYSVVADDFVTNRWQNGANLS